MIENKQYLRELIDKGYLMEKFSDDGKLVLYNYTNKCMYEKKWNKITLNARGHVYEVGTGKLVAKSFSKFFNLSELATSKQRNLLKKTDYKCYEKVDGSLGIIYYYDGKWRVNTRGSFNSEQAIEAQKLLEEKYDLSQIPIINTLLVEIIYPENRIIIDYGTERKLVLLAVYSNIRDEKEIRGFLEVFSERTKIPFVKEFNLTFDEMFEFQESKELSKEGFVVRFINGERVKIKSKRYLEIARILANLTPLSLWKVMENGKVKQDSIELIPEEFQVEIKQIVKELELQYQILKIEIQNDFDELMKSNPTRKEIGLNDNINHKGAIFSLLNEKFDKLDNYIMKRIRPRGNELESTL